jgi:hypothetical protein
MIEGIVLLDVRNVLVPSMGLDAPRISKTTFYLSGEGDGRAIRIHDGTHVSDDFYESLVAAKDVAERICNKRFSTDIILEQDKNIARSGDSGGLMFSLAMMSMLERVPIDPKITGTGRIDYEGIMHPVGNLREKALVVQQVGFKRFLVPYDPNFRILPRGLGYVFVADVLDAWNHVKGENQSKSPAIVSFGG